MFAEREALSAGIDRSASQELAPLDLAPPELDTLSDKLVDINVVDAPLQDVLRILADQLKMNLVADPAIAGLDTRATFVMRHVAARSVLEDVFRTYDIAGSVRGSKIYVSLMQSATFHIGMLGTSAALSVDEGGDVFGGYAKQNSTQLKGATTLKEDVGTKESGYEQLVSALQGILTDSTAASLDRQQTARGGFFTLDRQTGTLFVSARPSHMTQVQTLVDSVKSSRRKQIQIEAQIIDVTLSDQYQLGVDWTLLSNRLVGRLGAGAAVINQVTTPLTGGLAGRAITLPAVNVGSSSASAAGLAYNGSSFSAALNALRSFGTVRMLSNPVIRVRNGVPAYLSVGQNIRYVSKIDSTLNNIGGSSSATSTDVETDALFSGIVIGVSATVDEGGRIELFVRPIQTVVEPASLALVSVGNGNSVTLPIVDMKGMTTNLSVNNGDTIIIGGLIDESSTTSNQGLPGLADIPVVGHVFDNASSNRTNRELVLVIRARLS